MTKYLCLTVFLIGCNHAPAGVVKPAPEMVPQGASEYAVPQEGVPVPLAAVNVDPVPSDVDGGVDGAVDGGVDGAGEETDCLKDEGNGPGEHCFVNPK